MIKANFRAFLRTAPFKTIGILVLGWFCMVILTYFINQNLFFTGTRITFPISVVYFSQFKLTGIISALAFLIAGFWLLMNYQKFRTGQLIFFYAVLIVLANLSQGSFYDGYLKPFLATDFQYYHDAILIHNGENFIRHFNENQESLLMHTKTHPPFITWLHFVLLKVSGNSVTFLSIIFSLIGIAAIFPLVGILNMLNVAAVKRNLLVLIFAFIPAVNIYSVVSIDGLFLTFSMIFLYGLITVYHQKRFSLWGTFFMFMGIALTNLISFGGTFLLAFSGFLAIFVFYKTKNSALFFSTAISIILLGLVLLALYLGWDYDHIKAFRTASHLENPNGFRGFHQPWVYFFTRLENISEIMLFLSFGFFAYLFSRKFWANTKPRDLFPISIVAFLTLMLMFLTGAYGTGETARACNFIYPYFLLFLVRQQNRRILINIAIIALFQSFGMQLIGDYFY